MSELGEVMNFCDFLVVDHFSFVSFLSVKAEVERSMELALGLDVLKKYSDQYLASGGTLKHPTKAKNISRRSFLQSTLRASIVSGQAPGQASSAFAANNNAANSSLMHTTSFRHSVLREKRKMIKKDVLNLLCESDFPIQMEYADDFSSSFLNHEQQSGEIDQQANAAAVAAEAAKKAAQRVNEKLRETKRKEHEENTVLDALLDARREQLEEIDRAQRQRRVQERKLSNSLFMGSTTSHRKSSSSAGPRRVNSQARCGSSSSKRLEAGTAASSSALGTGAAVSLNSSLPLLRLM